MTIKRLHILTAEEHRSLVDPDADWYWYWNKENTPHPVPPMPEPPYPVGTYFAVELADHRWEIKRVGKPAGRHTPLPPYLRQDRTKHYTWSERTISVHPTKEEARKELIRLVAKQ